MEQAISNVSSMLLDLQARMLQTVAGIYLSAATFLVAATIACIIRLFISDRGRKVSG